MFLNAGDPILLRVGENLAKESTEFSIDGVEAMVLARNGFQVILRDEHPGAGMRTIAARRFSMAVPFIVLQMKLAGAAGARNNAIEITVLGREGIDLPALPMRRLALYNFDPTRLKIERGKRDPVLVSLTEKDGKLTASCRVELLRPGAPSFDGVLSESALLSPRAPLLRWPWP